MLPFSKQAAGVLKMHIRSPTACFFMCYCLLFLSFKKLQRSIFFNKQNNIVQHRCVTHLYLQMLYSAFLEADSKPLAGREIELV